MACVYRCRVRGASHFSPTNTLGSDTVSQVQPSAPLHSGELLACKQQRPHRAILHPRMEAAVLGLTCFIY
jgi:hypothetical protein